jgi:hypothetical protein
VQLIDQAGGHKLGVDGATAFHHEPANVATTELVQQHFPVEPKTGAHHVGEAVELLTHLVDRRVDSKDKFVTAVVPELELRIEVTAARDSEPLSVDGWR